jgi:adenine-specific DNA-methyltransferase
MLEKISTNVEFQNSWNYVKLLTKKFQSEESYYLSYEYQEAQVRQDFIDKLFTALGWDVNHQLQHDPYRQEVKIEKPEKKAKGRADYAFSLEPQYKQVRFFVEAKRPQKNIATASNCFQVIRYSWSNLLPIAVLTDFNHLYIIDTRYQPKFESAESRIVLKWHCSEFNDVDRFAKLYWLLSREAVSKGSIEFFADNELPTHQVATKQYSLFGSGGREFDEVFLQQMDEWRHRLAVSFNKTKQDLTSSQLTECVQRTLDRLIFIRFLEDKGIESTPIIERFGQGNKSHWQDFIQRSRSLDQTYNGVVFKPHSVLDSREFNPDIVAFSEVCDDLTDEHSPYNFNSIPIDILGRIYESFLGKVVEITKNKVTVVEKEDVRSAGGVFYTPSYIVAYMVEQSLKDRIRNKKPFEITSLRIIDTSCGSGSFLIGAFGYLLEVITAYYRKKPTENKKVHVERDGLIYLTLPYKREILTKCIFGVDIDQQAVEVAQLSLYLKLMEEETAGSAYQQQLEMGVALLPTLTSNIVVGNALVTLDMDEQEDSISIEKKRQAKSLDFRAAFASVFEDKDGGFDLVIGNPPYIKENTNKAAFEHVRSSPYYQGKMDLWYMFACRGLDILKPEKGILAYIATNNWVTNSGAMRLRAKIVADSRIIQLIDFGEFKVFKDAGIQTMILIAKNSKKTKSYEFDYRRLNLAKGTLAEVQSLLAKKPIVGCEYLSPTIDRSREGSTPLTFSSVHIEALLNKLEKCRNFQLDPRLEVAQGIVSPQDSVNKAAKAKLGKDFSLGAGVFVLNSSEKQKLNLSKKEYSLVKPFFTSKELERYTGESKNKLWVIYTSSQFKKPLEMTPYPAIKKHLDQFHSIITSSNKPYGLHRARDERYFNGEKIAALRKCVGQPCFTYTDFPCYVSQTFNVIKSDRVNLLYLTGLLNSKIVKFWLKHRGKMQGNNYQIDKEPLMAIPLRVPSTELQEDIAKLVKYIIALKKNMPISATDSEKEYQLGLINQTEGKIQMAIEIIYELNEQDRILLHGKDGL